MFFIPESPRWLILQGRFEDGVKALERVRPKGADVRAEADEIQAAIDKERETASGVSVWDMFKDPVDRRRTYLSVCAVTLQAASGSMFIIGKRQANATGSVRRVKLLTPLQHTRRISSPWPTWTILLP